MPARSKSSTRWLREHRDDVFVRSARTAGYRSRSAFKLEDLDARYRLLASGDVVIDLGAAPGGWSQFAASKVAPAGRVIAVDVLACEPIVGVDFIRGDFTEQAVLDRVRHSLAGAKASLVMSDMAPNMSGIKAVDQARAMCLAELAFEMARESCMRGGNFVVKVFQGEGCDAYLTALRSAFAEVSRRKPPASRPRSSELYVVARHYGV